MMRNKTLLISVILLLLFNGQKGLSFSQSIDNNSVSNKAYNVSSLEWKLWGYRPENWKLDFNFTELKGSKAEYISIPAKVPGSVQKALRDAGIIDDWNIGNNYISIEWIENRHWIFAAKIPDEWINKESNMILRCLGLDEVTDKESARIEEIKIVTEADKMKDHGNLKISAELTPRALHGKVRIQLSKDTGEPVFDETFPAAQLRTGKVWDNLKIKRWWPNGSGDQVLYKLVCTLYDADGKNCQVIERNAGFKNIEVKRSKLIICVN